MNLCRERNSFLLARINEKCKEETKMSELNLNEMEKVSGGLVVDDPEKNKFWIIRPNGTVIAPAPTKELAIEFAKQFGTSPTVIDMKEYKAKFGRDLVW
jgi:hypothetical protein